MNAVYSLLKILVIDDDDFILFSIMAQLNNIGIGIIGDSPDGAAGILEMVRIKPDIIICDVQMKPWGGFKFIEHMKKIKNGEFSKTPLIMISSDSSMDTIKKASKYGVHDYLIKPIAQDKLKHHIDKIINSTPAILESVQNRKPPMVMYSSHDQDE